MYGEVQGFALNHAELVRDFHQLTVDAYAAQHAPREVGGDVPPISVAYALVGLHLALDRGLSGIEVRAAHQRMGRPDPSWPRLPTPERTGAMTVFDVAAVGPRGSSGLTAMSHLAETRRSLVDLHGARELHEQTLAARRRMLGEDHPDTLASMDNLETMHRELGGL